MAMDWHNLLADDDWGGIGQIVFIVILLILSGLGSLFSKIKEKEKAARERRPPQRESSDAAPEEEMVAALRQAEQEQAQAVAAARRAAAQQAAAQQTARAQRPAASAPRPRIRKRTAPESSQRRIAQATQAPARPDAAAGAAGRIDLSGADEARRAIIYSEILGAPKALRGGPEPWER